MQQSQALLAKEQSGSALVLAREAVVAAHDNLFTETALGDAAAGDKQMAKTAWQAAIQIAQHLEFGAQSSYIPDLESKIKGYLPPMSMDRGQRQGCLNYEENYHCWPGVF